MSEFWGEKKLISWLDIAKGIGEVVLHSLFDQIHHEPPLVSDHVKPKEPYHGMTQEDWEAAISWQK